MRKYVLQRVVYMVITLYLIATATFFLMKLLPGTPLSNPELLTPEQQAMILEQFGLNDSIFVQYINYMTNLLQGDLGVSFIQDNRPVATIIMERIGPSAQLGVQALILGTVCGLLLGIVAALKNNSWMDYGATVFSVLGMSVPSFVLGALLSYVIGVQLQWLPVALWDGPEYTILPTIALSVSVTAQIARFTRSELLEVLSSDYIVTAKAKGISQGAVLVKHGLRNALIPVITILGPLAVNLITGTLVVEQIFAVPGLGAQFVQSIMTNDYSLIMGITLFFSTLLIFVIFIVDLLYGVIDPRIRLDGGSK